ncbi:MAG: hypothetical protein SFY69_10425 [Planctomycetota bacterium]|nr:hypothetical protein [Planctomycetota bacterium]
MKRLLGVLALAASAGLAQGQLVVGNDQSGTATIYYIDVASGAATPLYSATTTDAKPWGMAYDPATNTLYWNNGANLYSSPFSTESLTPTLLGGMTYNGATVNFVGLAFRDGALLGTRNITTEAVYRIDVETREATLLYAYPTTFDFGGLDVDSTTGVLYGLSDSGSPRGIYSIDVAAQTTAFTGASPASDSDVDGLAVYDGTAYGVTDGNNTSQPNFYIFDLESGQQVGTLPSPFTGTGTFAAAAFIPPSGPTCDPDFNADGNVDQDDIACIAQVVGGDPTCASADPDFNRDGNVDQDDVAALEQVVAGAPCP